jgi:hypothetical protein
VQRACHWGTSTVEPAKSTGPRTREDKAASSRNALRHGLLSTQITLPDEDTDTFEEVSTQMLAELAPVGPLERLLVERITETIGDSAEWDAWKQGSLLSERMRPGPSPWRLVIVATRWRRG